MSLALDLVIVARDDQDGDAAPGRTVTPAVQARRIVNAMSVDVEDYFQVSRVRSGRVARWRGTTCDSRVVGEHTAACWTARSTGCAGDVLYPRLGGRALIRSWSGRLPARGHEIASHGYNHQLVYMLTPQQFREDVRAAKAALEDAIGSGGYRLPGAELLHHDVQLLGARHPDRGGISLRHEHLPDSSRPIRHSRRAAASPSR